MASAVVFGQGHERLLRSEDRTERLVEAIVLERVTDLQSRLEEQRIEKMANAIAKRFS